MALACRAFGFSSPGTFKGGLNLLVDVCKTPGGAGIGLSGTILELSLSFESCLYIKSAK